MTLPFSTAELFFIGYFLKNFLLPYPATPSNPEPRRSMVAGSGTGAPPPGATQPLSSPSGPMPCTWAAAKKGPCPPAGALRKLNEFAVNPTMPSMSYITVSPAVNLSGELAVGKSNKISYLPSPSAWKASTPVSILLGTAGLMPTAAKVNWVGSNAVSRLKDHSETNSTSVRPRALIVSRTNPGLAASSKVALSHGGGPAGGVPSENSILKSNVRVPAEP